MSYKIIVDSCGELLEEWKNDERYESVPLTLMVDGEQIIDDESFCQADFLKKVAASASCPGSACPSPERYLRAFDCDADHVYAVTLSAELSGSYNSAVLGKNLLEEEKPDCKIHVFNSKSASIGETLIAMKITECEESGMSFEQTVAMVEAYIASQHTYFVLDSLDALRKNGRLTGVKALVATALKIKPVMGSTDEGNIAKLDQARGMNRALVKMVEHVMADTPEASKRVIAVSHCNAKEHAEMVKDALLERLHPKDVIVLDTAGVSSLYASDGGIIVVA